MSDTPAEAMPFEQSLAQLEQIVRALEDGQLSLDDALPSYEQGVRLIKDCHARLQQAEQRILLLTGVEQGEPILQPFKHESTAPARPSPAPRLRRKIDEPTA
jgi:exodeoxyribonuclease VII small subunit